MLVELVSLLNDDGLRLDGAFYPPTEGADRAGPVDAVLLIHGSRGNFYDGATKSMAEDLSAQGYACLPLNTNAHDTAWYNPGSREFKGNAFEVLADTCIDLRAGIDHLEVTGASAFWVTAWELCGSLTTPPPRTTVEWPPLCRSHRCDCPTPILWSPRTQRSLPPISKSRAG